MRLRSPVSIFTAAVAALAGTALSSSADEVRLLDGSLVRGKITHIRDGIMTIQPSFAEKPLIIKMGEIENFATDDPVFLMMNTDATFYGTVLPGFGDTVSISSPHHGISSAGTPEISWLWRKDDPSPADLRVQKKDRHWEFTCTAGLNVTTGTTESFNGRLGFDAINVGEVDKLRMFSFLRYSEVEDTASEDNFHIGADYDDAKYKPILWYAKTDNGYDRIAKQNFFSTTSLGLGYRFVENDFQTFDIRLGGAFRYEAYERDAGVEDISTLASEIGFDNEFRLPFGKVVTNFTYSPALENPKENYRITHHSYLQTIYYNDLLAVKTGVTNTYNSIVAIGNKNLDTTVYVELVFKLK
ncbi:MAG: DUF481 domain-containing protein [Verrucomicrobia bacterium]|nr:DUF481 domain-containing protein [Verrucomicrobiota bacterium]